MKKHSCLPKSGSKLCHECGPSIDTDDVSFTRRESNLVYMDKIFSYNEGTTCPIIGTLTTANHNYVSELVLEPIDKRPRRKCGCHEDSGCGNNGCGNNGCGNNSCGNDNCSGGCSQCCCCCCNSCGSTSTCSLTSDAVFNIDKSYVLVEMFTLESPSDIAACNVTVDGVYVDSLSYANGQFTATTNNLIPQISKERCLDLGLPTKAFFLITCAGPWVFRATFVLEGTVNTGGKTCCFQAKFKNRDCCPIPINGTTNFALPRVSLPCSVNGVAPLINFRFGGAVNMLNPEICVHGDSDGCQIFLNTRLAIEPKINLEVVRKTLFCVEACEGLLPCDGTKAAYYTENEEEDCEWPPKPPCKCGTAVSPEMDDCICEKTPVCNFDDDEKKCSCSKPRERNDNGCYQFNGCNGCSW